VAGGPGGRRVDAAPRVAPAPSAVYDASPVRWLLVLVLVNGLVPDLAEAAEAVVHVVIEGHVPHTATDPCEEDRGSEHGCGTTRHQCTCCASQALALQREAAQVARQDVERGAAAPTSELELSREPSRPFRPPIG
jgi:hypothetical protein